MGLKRTATLQLTCVHVWHTKSELKERESRFIPSPLSSLFIGRALGAHFVGEAICIRQPLSDECSVCLSFGSFVARFRLKSKNQVDRYLTWSDNVHVNLEVFSRRLSLTLSYVLSSFRYWTPVLRSSITNREKSKKWGKVWVKFV